MDPAAPSDAELMRAVQAGERAAWEALYHRWKGPIFAFLLRRAGARAPAEEALQETWLRLYRSRARFDPQRPFKAWIFTIAANAGRDARQPEPDLLRLSEELAGPRDPLELRDALLSALFSLTPGDRRLLLLETEGFEPKEIAAMLGIRPGTARVRLHRARQRVAAALGGMP